MIEFDDRSTFSEEINDLSTWPCYIVPLNSYVSNY